MLVSELLGLADDHPSLSCLSGDEVAEDELGAHVESEGKGANSRLINERL